MRRKFLAAVLDGVSLPATVYSRHHFPRVIGTDLERLRGDVKRVGGDFKTVIIREHGNSKTLSGTRARSDSKP